MADPVSSEAAPAVEPKADAEASPAQRKPGPRPGALDSRTRFGIAYLVLAALVGAAVGLFIVFLGDSHRSGQLWSSFKPAQNGDTPTQIARQVQTRYRLPSGATLVAIANRDASLQNQGTTFPIGAVLIRPPGTGGTPSVYRTSHTLFFALCGLSTVSDCAIPGKASAARLALLQREILELSLYSFKYAGADAVVAYAPPIVRHGTTLRTIAFVRRNDWQPALQRPLGVTLPRRSVSTPYSLTPRDLQVAGAIRFYDYRFEPLGDGSLVLVATPLQG